MRGISLVRLRKAVTLLLLATLLTALSAAPLTQLKSVNINKAQAAGGGLGGGGAGAGNNGPTGFPSGIDPSAKKIVSGPIIFEYTPTGGGKTADIEFHSWSPTEQDLINQVKSPPNNITNYTQDDYDDLNTRVNGGGDFLSGLSNDPEWDACEGGQIVSSPNGPQSQNDAACSSNATQVSNAIYISLFDYKGTPTIQYVMPAPPNGGSTSNQGDLLNGTGNYFPKYYKANDQTTGGAIPGIEDLHHNVHYYYATGFGGDWLPLKLGNEPKKDVTGPALYFGHQYSSGDVLSGAIDAVLGLIDSLFRSSFSLISDAVDNAGSIPSILSTGTNIPQTWGVLRDAVDVMFLLILIVIAFANTIRFDVEAYGIRALLPRFIVAVILVNFGLYIVQFLIDFSNVLMAAISSLPQPGKVKTGASLATSLGEIPITSIANFTFSLILLAAAFFLAIFLWVLMQMRILVVWFLAVVSPVAFLMMVLPITRSLWLSWWKQFIRWILIGPAVVLILWIGSSISGGIQFTSASDNLRRPFFAIISMALACIIPITLGGKFMAGVANRVKRVGKSGAQLGSRAALSGRGEAVRGKGWIGTGQEGLLGGKLANTPLIGMNSRAKQVASTEALATRRTDEGRIAAKRKLEEAGRIPAGSRLAEETNQINKQAKLLEGNNVKDIRPAYERAITSGDGIAIAATGQALAESGKWSHEDTQKLVAAGNAGAISRLRQGEVLSKAVGKNISLMNKGTATHDALTGLAATKDVSGRFTNQTSYARSLKGEDVLKVTSQMEWDDADASTRNQIVFTTRQFQAMNQGLDQAMFIKDPVNSDPDGKKHMELSSKMGAKYDEFRANKKVYANDDQAADATIKWMQEDAQKAEYAQLLTNGMENVRNRIKSAKLVTAPSAPPTPAPPPPPNYSAWNAEDGFNQGEHGEFPVPDEGGEEKE